MIGDSDNETETVRKILFDKNDRKTFSFEEDEVLINCQLGSQKLDCLINGKLIFCFIKCFSFLATVVNQICL
jgi:hypothetical protein